MRVAMGDISAEPSMEEILSSIKRIIAEEGDAGQPRAPRRAPTARSATMAPAPQPDQVLELSEPMPSREASTRRAEQAPRMAEPVHYAPASAVPEQPEPIVSQAAAAASRGSLDTLSRLVVKPESAPTTSQSDGTLEGMVRDMLRPMLRDWLDSKLPEMVEVMVAREIERITGAR